MKLFFQMLGLGCILRSRFWAHLIGTFLLGAQGFANKQGETNHNGG